MTTQTPYVVVADAGTDKEAEVKAFASPAAAYTHKDKYGHLANLDVMKRLPDGTLTTDF